MILALRSSEWSPSCDGALRVRDMNERGKDKNAATAGSLNILTVQWGVWLRLQQGFSTGLLGFTKIEAFKFGIAVLKNSSFSQWVRFDVC